MEKDEIDKYVKIAQEALKSPETIPSVLDREGDKLLKALVALNYIYLVNRKSSWDNLPSNFK